MRDTPLFCGRIWRVRGISATSVQEVNVSVGLSESVLFNLQVFWGSSCHQNHWQLWPYLHVKGSVSMHLVMENENQCKIMHVQSH